MSKCKYCQGDFSYSVLPLHVPFCEQTFYEVIEENKKKLEKENKKKGEKKIEKN